ncbi:MAG: methyltransferase family protein [Psychromonas sp.]
MLRILQYPPVVTLLFMVMIFFIHCLSLALSVQLPILHWIALFIVIASFCVILSGGWAFKKAQTTVNPTTPEKTTTLVISGIYRYSRNPMYLGLAGFLFAEACLLGNVLCLAVLPFYIYIINKRFIEPEERALMAIFGDPFNTYKKQVRAWL